jgi:hypothetical protein
MLAKYKIKTSSVVRVVWVAVIVILTGCQGAPTTAQISPSIPLPEATPTELILVLPTDIELEPEISSLEIEDPDLPPVPPGCTVVTKQFSPEPTEQSLFPPVSERDWSLGPETAAVTVIEYADFQ